MRFFVSQSIIFGVLAARSAMSRAYIVEANCDAILVIVRMPLRQILLSSLTLYYGAAAISLATMPFSVRRSASGESLNKGSLRRQG
eukprot:4684012-Pleurochrysis_carterae.AAC.2